MTNHRFLENLTRVFVSTFFTLGLVAAPEFNEVTAHKAPSAQLAHGFSCPICTVVAE